MSTKKMMLVTFNKQRPNRDIQQLDTLDNEMINIIISKNLSLNQKIELYQEKLSKFVDKNKYLEIEQQLRPQFQTNDFGSVVNNKINDKQIEQNNFSYDDDDDDENNDDNDYYDQIKNREDTQYDYKYDDNSYSNNIEKTPNNKSFNKNQDDLIESFLHKTDKKIDKLKKTKSTDSIAQQLVFSPLSPIITRDKRKKLGIKSPNELFSAQQRKKTFERNKLLENDQSNANNPSTSTFQKLLTNNDTPLAPYIPPYKSSSSLNENNPSISAFQKLLNNKDTPQAPYIAPYKVSSNISNEQQSKEIGPNTEKWISMNRGDLRKSKNNNDLTNINETRTPISLANLGINLKQSSSNSK